VAVVVWILTLAVAAGVARRPLFVLLAIAAVLVLALLRRRVSILLFMVVVCGASALGWCASRDFESDCRAVARVAGAAGAAPVELEGIVSGFPQTGHDGSSFDFITVLENRRVRLALRSGCFDVSYGDRYRLRARLVKSSPSMTRFNASRGVCAAARVRASDMVLVGRGGNPLLRDVFWPLHRFARTRLARAMGRDAGLAIGMLLGERTELENPVRNAVRRLGITHLLAISGMHLTTVAGCVLTATRLWPRGRPLALWAALTLYTGMVGSIDSLTRAYIMAAILIGAHAAVRPVRPVDALAKALLIMSVASPLCLQSVGLQLSFAATFAVLVCLPRVWRPAGSTGNRVRRRLQAAIRSAGSAFTLSLAVEVFIAPLQLHHFHSLSAVGPLGTMVFLIPVTLVLLGAVPVVLWTAVAPAHEWAGCALGTLSLATTHAILVCARVTPGPLTLPEPNLWLYYGGLYVGWRMRGRVGGWLAGAFIIALSFVGT
jgi:ComEC/Rec2-related protein